MRFFLMLLPVLSLAACTTKTIGPRCDEGFEWDEAADDCLPITDASVPDAADAADAAATDSSVDACACSGVRDICSGEECVECVTEADCAAPLGTCDESGTCVACATHDDCTVSNLAQCNPIGQCVSCADDMHCAGVVDAPVCNGGNCAECAASDESACGANVCDVQIGMCTDTPAGMTGLCQQCVSARQCMPGMACVGMGFGDPRRELGSFCLWRESATEAGAPDGSCFSVRPYVRGEMLPLVGGGSEQVCGLAVTTCAALDDFRAVDCGSPPDPPMDEACGVTGLSDGLCRLASGSANRCTTPCGSSDDCKPGFSCNTTVTPNYCNL